MNPILIANSKVKQIGAGGTHACALLENGLVKCWGASATGQLGYANTEEVIIGDNEKPTSIDYVDVGGTVTQIAPGSQHTCALLDNGHVRCWGYNYAGELGYGHLEMIGDDEVPSTEGDVDVGGIVVQISAGGAHTCALLNTGDVRCWGMGQSGQLGYGNNLDIGDNEFPASAGNVDVGGTVVQVSAGGLHTCVLLDTGNVRCWGYNEYGQLGYKHTNNIGDDEFPSTAKDVDVGGTVVQVSAGYAHTCALLNTGDVRCWGNSQYGQLGYGNTNIIGDTETPASAGNVPYR